MTTLLGHFNRQPRSVLLIRAYATIVIVTGVDYLTGPDLSLLILYFFPIIVVSWYLGRRHGIAMAFAAGLATSMHDLFVMDSLSVTALPDLLRYWAFIQAFGVFLVVSIVIAAMRSFEDEKRAADHKLARKVQSFLLPQSQLSMDHFTCFGASKSFDHLSGDFFDLVRVGPHKLAIIVGDICGKGVSAALLMAYVQGVLRSHILLDKQSLGNLIRTVNGSLHLSTADDRFATLFIGVYDDENQELTYVNAGHDPPVLLRWNGPARGTGRSLAREARSAVEPALPENGVPTIIKLKPGGMLLGVDPAAEYTVNMQTFQPGDILVCDTDGVKEARNGLEEMYGLERLTHVVSEHRQQPLSAIYSQVLDDIERFVGTEPQFDDMTLVIGKVL
jgi:sigma-B regulation protein RsbU (phosphoserine phosphatase)